MYVIRHGETGWNVEGRMQGWVNCGLTESGLSQASAVALGVCGLGIEHIYCSDLGRAVETAGVIGQELALSVQADLRLRERNLGIAQGLTVAEFRAKFPTESERFFSGDPDYVISEGESIAQRHLRSWQGAEEICARHCGQTVLIVAHGGTLTSLFNHAVGLSPAAERNYSLFNGSINRFTVAGDRWQLDTWGDISHLKHLAAPQSLQRYV